MEKLIETVDLNTDFNTFEGVVKALNGVNIYVQKGETYGLVGESGCGKSVTVRSIMRIVQSPGKITGGKILLYFSDSHKESAVDILKRSETYMESVRGNDISMIFQEASSSLNPVFSIGEQIGESFLFHRLPEMLEKTIAQIEGEIPQAKALSRGWKRMSVSLFKRELAARVRYEAAIRELDARLYEISERSDEGSVKEVSAIARKRRALKKTSPLVRFAKRFPAVKRYQKRLDAVVEANVIDLLKDLGVPNPANVVKRYPHELSGGMQQRIVIAIALACHPRLLIADEPTSNLDVTIQAQILELIRELKKTKISSVLFITHDLGVVAEICDRVSVMYAGDVCETAPVRDIFRGPLHPYTKGLLNSVPKIDQKGELNTIPGAVPNLIDPPSGCRFHPRCPNVMDVCSREKPPYIEHSPGHFVACYLYGSKDSNS